MENGNDGIDLAISARLRELRAGQGLTLEALAERSGVSRAMISRVERGEASPTAQLLSRLCTALGQTLSAFFAMGESSDPLARRADQPVWRDPESGYRRRAVSPPGTPSRVEIVDVAFPPGARVAFPPETARAGMTQQVWLFAGIMELQMADGRVHRLEPGDCLYMSITEGHVFHNPGEEPAHYAVILDRGFH